MVDETKLEEFTDEELEKFMEKRRAKSLIPNLNKQIEILTKLDEVASDLINYPYTVPAYGSKRDVNNLIHHIRDSLAHLKDDKENIDKFIAK